MKTILLDTCVFLWILQNPKKLSPLAFSLIENANNVLLFSAVSHYEIVQKYQRGKLDFPDDPNTIILKEMEERCIDTLPFDIHASVHAQSLPLIHADPFDRMLIAQSKAYNLPIVTSDSDIQKYDIDVVW